MTVNYFALRHQWTIEVYTREHSELIKQYARIIWASQDLCFSFRNVDDISANFPGMYCFERLELSATYSLMALMRLKVFE